jgi:hypothetical protein
MAVVCKEVRSQPKDTSEDLEALDSSNRLINRQLKKPYRDQIAVSAIDPISIAV